MGNKGERRGGGSDDNYLDLMAAVVAQQVEDAYDTKVPLRKGERGEGVLGLGGVRASGAALARNTGILDMENGSLGLVGAAWRRMPKRQEDKVRD